MSTNADTTLAPTTPLPRKKMQWGYAGVYPGEFNVWKGDVLMNQLAFQVRHGFRSTGIHLGAVEEPARLEQVAAHVAEHDLQLSIHWRPSGGYFEASLDDNRRAVDAFLARLAEVKDALRVPLVTTGVGACHRFMAEPALPAQLDRLAAVFAPVVAGLKDLGLRFGIENHGDYYCSDLVELCERVPGLGIFLDTGNCFLVGEPPVPASKLAAPYAVGTHFKDHLVAPNPRELKFELTGAALGEGHVGLREIYDDLLALNPDPYALVMQVEFIPPKGEDPHASLERSKRFLAELPEN